MTTITQTITALPTAPARTDDPSVFITRADAMMAALPTMVTQENTWAGQANTVAGEVNSNAATATTQAATATTQAALATTQATNAAASAVTAVNAPGTNATSTTSLAVATGSKSLTIQTSKSLVVGMSVKIAYTVTPTTWMFGDITAHDSSTGALTVNVTEVNGSGTQAAWTVSLSGPSGAGGSAVVQYPQLIKSANYTLVLADAGYHIFHPATDTAARTFTIPANSSVAFDIGTILVFVNPNGAQRVTVAITTDTLINTRGVTGSQKVGANNILTALKITATSWMCYFADDDVPDAFLALGLSATPYVTAYLWSITGFGARVANPSTLPAGPGKGAAFSPAGTELAIAHENTPFLTAYPWSSSGFGVKFTNPATLPTGDLSGVAFSPAGTEIAVANTVSPNVTAYPWSYAGFGVKFTNPATLPTGVGNGIAFSAAGTEIAIAHQTTPFVTAYPWSGSGFGVKFTNPATLPTGAGYGIAFSAAGTEIAVAHQTTPFVTAYPWSSAGFGVKFANPSTLPADTGYSAAFVQL